MLVLVFRSFYYINKFLTKFSFIFVFRTKSKALRQYEAKTKQKSQKINKLRDSMQHQLLSFDGIVSMMTPKGSLLSINIFSTSRAFQ